MHKIHWTDKQKEIAELLGQGKSYKELREAGYGCENIELVISAIRRGETPPPPPNFEVPAIPRGPRPGNCPDFAVRGGHATPLFGKDNWGGMWGHAIALMKQIIKELEGQDLNPQNRHAVDLMKEIMAELEPTREERKVRVIPQKEIDEMFVLASRPVEVTYHPGGELAMAQNAYRVCALRLGKFADWLHPSRFGACQS